jgi:KDO2-lipid IV(A) lauroyltransferase
MKRNLEVAMAVGLTHLARGLPRDAGLRVFSAMGVTAGRIMKRDKEMALKNLEMAFPESTPIIREALARAMFKSLGMNVYEFLNLEGSSPERVRSLVERVEGMEHLLRAFGEGRGVIGITGHIGCFELLPAYIASMGYSVQVVGRELWEKRIARRLIGIRESLGYKTIDRDRGGREILRHLRGGGALGVLMDQHTRVSGIYVPFFNKEAHTPIGVAKMALATGAKIIPMAVYMTRNRKHEIKMLPAVEPDLAGLSKSQRVDVLTRECSGAIEQLVRYDPKQWVWFHDRWRGLKEGFVRYEAVH